jgi:hypothetical protein
MDFSIIFQLRTKKFWWMDVIFYFVISLLVATVLCWLIFMVKNSMIRNDIAKEIIKLQEVGTDTQKQEETDVINYRKKINDFTGLFANHQFASNVFAFVQSKTIPNIWFKQFTLDEKGSTVQLSGETDDVDSFSRQVAILEGDKYIKGIGTLNSSSAKSGKVDFNINLSLDKSIFDYIAQTASASQTISADQQNAQENPPDQTGTPVNTEAGGQQTPAVDGATKSSEKLITSFHFLLNPEVIGVADQTNYKFILDVPYETDVKNLAPSLVISPGATVLPESNVSQDFSGPVIYTVTAEDGSIQKYEIKVNVRPAPVVEKKSNQAGFITLIIILIIVGIIVLLAGLFFLYKNKFKNKR